MNDTMQQPLPAKCAHCGRVWTLAAGTQEQQGQELANHDIGHYIPVTDPKLTGKRYQNVNEAYQTALAYVWGRQDEAVARGADVFETKDTGNSQEFAGHYAFRKRQWILEAEHRMPPLVDAYKEWRETGGIAS